MTDRARRQAISDLLDLWLERGARWMIGTLRRHGAAEIADLATADILAILAAERAAPA